MDLIRPPGGKIKATRVYGTAYGQSVADDLVFRNRITRFLQGVDNGVGVPTPDLVGATCAEFFKDYALTLASR